jgi:3-deoxy-D-manno-octulosonate 8-phosphate phosphatase (KDO 8-P phosphatase)
MTDKALAAVRLLLMDVDGVLTDGSIAFDADGRETKTFHVYDGLAIAIWHRAGFLSGFVSGRGTKVVEMRAKELGVHELHLGRIDKAPIVAEILARRGLAAGEVAYLGDDIVDLPAMAKVGVTFAPANARAEIKERVQHVTLARGGQGAVREVVEMLLVAKGLWAGIVQRGGVP